MIDTIKALEQTNSRNDKEDILSDLKREDVNMFKYIAYLAYDPSVDFYIKEFNTKDVEFVPSISLYDALHDLHKIIATRTFTGNKAKQWVEMTYSMLNEGDAEIFKRVVKRDLRCGVSAKTVNKIWPNTIYEHPYMRASGFSEKTLKNISFPCYSQTKMDGLYLDIMVFEDKVEYRTRNGSFLLLNENDFDRSLIKHFPNQVLMGEALVLNNSGELLDRQTSNGYLNSNEIDPSLVKFFIWDMVPLNDFKNGKSKVSYNTRFDELCINLGFLDNQRIDSVDTVLCNNQDEIIYDFREKRMEGEEGTIIKDMNLEWKPGTSKHQIKVKVVFDCDIKIVDYKMGTGKYEGMIGSLVGESSCGRLKVSVGTGLKDSQRKEFVNKVDEWIENETVMAIKANDICTNQDDPDKYALFLPRFIEIRTDKKEPDGLDRIEEQIKSFTDALDLIN